MISQSIADPDRFAVIFERHFDEVLRYLRRRHPRAAEDLATDVFTIAFDSRARFVAQGESARPWLYGIASNLLAKQWRSEQRGLRAHARLGGQTDVVRDEFEAARARADAERQSARVAGALAKCKPADRDTILLYALADLSYDEIAVAQAVPIGTVRSRLSRARKVCAAELGLADGELGLADSKELGDE